MVLKSGDCTGAETIIYAKAMHSLYSYKGFTIIIFLQNVTSFLIQFHDMISSLICCCLVLLLYHVFSQNFKTCVLIHLKGNLIQKRHI